MTLRAPRTSRPRHVLRATLLAACSALLVPACDNPACVFGGDCGGAGGGLGGNAASVPGDHAWLSPAAPRVEAFYPTGTTISSSTPIAVVFSESLSLTKLATSFRLVVDSETGGPPLPIFAPALVGDGRMLVVVPVADLPANTSYRLEYATDAVVCDLQGTAVVHPADRVLGTFKVAATNPAAPRVVATFPADNATGQSTTGEYVVLFDRRVNPVSVTASSWNVTVDGTPPDDDPLPESLTIIAQTGVAIPETRVWRYRSVDSDGAAVPLALSAVVALQLSPASAPILPETGATPLPPTTVDYTTAAFRSPDSAALTSLPADAIGLENFGAGSPLAIGIELGGAVATDALGIFLFGDSLEVEPKLIALYREAPLSELGFDELLQTASVDEAVLDLVSSVAPVTPRLEEGPISIGFVLKRGTLFSPVRMLDVDLDTLGVQSPLLDVTAPIFTGFGSSGTATTSFRSALAGLVVVGRASEEIRVAEVDCALGNNGLQQDVIAATAQGLFIARPVDLGLIDPAQMPLAFTLRIYDRALNSALATTHADYVQIGAVGPGAALPGGATIDVTVVDARTFAPIAGASVFVHEDLGLSFDLVDVGTSDADGFVQLAAAALGESLLTVDAPLYDLFSFHGLPSARISVPLARTGELAGVLSGTLGSSGDILDGIERFAMDARRIDTLSPLIDISACTYTALTDATVCTFGPGLIRPGPVGAVGVVGVEVPANAFSFSPTSFLRAYALELPVAGVSPQDPSTVSLSVAQLLSDAATPQEERALTGPALTLDATAAFGLVLAQLTGAPGVQVEGSVPGIEGPILAGLGASLDPLGSPADTWSVRSAIPGVADPTEGKYAGDVRGALFESGTLSGELFLRCEARDTLGGRSALRVPFSSAPASAALPGLPVIVSPGIGANTGGPSYDIVFADALPDGGDPGLYRVTLVDSVGRSWHLWRVDSTGLARSVHLPDIGADGGTPLESGNIVAHVSAYAWPSADPAAFLFTDPERAAQSIAAGAPLIFVQP